MKLIYDIPAALLEAIKDKSANEEIYYALPFDVDQKNGSFIEDGFVVITPRHLFVCRNCEVIQDIPMSSLSDFHTEMHYGVAAFYAVRDGATTCICQFVSGKHMARYSVVANACEALAKDPSLPPATNEEPEKFCPICGRKFLKGTKYCPYCRSKVEVYKKLWDMTKGMRLVLFFPILSAAISMILRFVVPAVQKTAINKYIVPENGVSGPMSGFLAVVAAIIAFDIISRALGVIQGRISAISGNKFTLRLREQMFEKLQTLSMSSISKKTTGDLMGRINNDVSIVQNFITNLLPSYFSQLFSFLVALVILIWMNPLMCLFVFVPLPIAVFAVVKFWKFMQAKWVRNWVLNRRLQICLQDTLSGIRVVKNYGNEDQAVDKYVKRSIDCRNHAINISITFNTFFPIIGFVLRLGSYLIMLYGNVMLFGGMMSVGELNQFNSYSNILYEPLMQINQIPSNLTQFFTSFSKILEILEEEPEIEDITDPVDLKMHGKVSVRNVTFGYDSYNPVLDNVCLEVNPGEMIGIVGLSGSGKTTLINMIMRLYDPTTGQIFVDGVNIKDISQTSLRSQIGVVLQETHLFSGTVRDNIRYSKPEADNAEIVRAAKLSGAHDFILSLPEGYNTYVGEKGYTLSGGERQRIAISRALIHDPSLLILDEATAALDTETEKQIQDAINKLSTGRTTIAIAHRLSTLREANKILVLENGHVSEFGTHAELLANRGIYYKLVMAQTEAAIAKGEVG